MTHLHIIMDNLNPTSPHHHGFTTHLKHLTLTSSPHHHHGTTITHYDLSSVLVLTAPQLRTLDLRGINRGDSTVVHAMLKHVVHIKLLLHCDILESIVQNDKQALSPNIVTMHVTFEAVTPSMNALLALWTWATSKSGHSMHCVIKNWTEEFETRLKTQLACTINGQTVHRLLHFDIEILDPAFDDPLSHDLIQEAWHMFVDHTTIICTTPNTFAIHNKNKEHAIRDIVLKISQSADMTLRLPWKTLEAIINADENVLLHNVSMIYVILGEPTVVQSLPRLKTMIALWKWATSTPGHALHCVINQWRATLLPPSFLEDALKDYHLIDEDRVPAHSFRFALSEFTFEMQDALCPKIYSGVLLHAWNMFFVDRIFTKVRTNLSRSIL